MMKTKFPAVFFSAVLMTFACVPSVLAQSPPRWFVDFEAGNVFPGYCDVRVDSPLEYNGLTFPANTPLDSVYRFNSYRLSWRYGIKEGERLRIGLGVTAYF